MSQMNCPRCGDMLRFPADLPSEAIVRCPLCTEEFPFSEMESRLPPMVEIVSLPEAADAALDRIDEFLTLKPSATAPASAPMVTTGIGSRSAARRRPAESPWRPLILLIEIALSGVVGVALAVLVLWWLPGQWHRDPLVLKPYAAKYAPWLLPPAHRPISDLSLNQDESEPNFTKKTEAKPSTPTKREADSPNPAAHEVERKNVPDVGGGNDTVSESPNLFEQPEQEKPGKTSPKEPEKELSFEEQLKKLTEEEAEPPELSWTSSPEITGLVKSLSALQEKASDSDDAKHNYVTGFRELARVTGQVNADDVGLAEARTRLNRWLASVADADWKAACEATQTDRAKPSNAPKGVIYLGKLKSALADGSWLHLDLEPVPGDPAFPVFIAPELFRASKGESLIGKEVYVLGSELPDPKRLISDVPLGTKTAWIVGAIVNAGAAKSPEKAAF